MYVEIQVPKGASIRELKEAVMEAFGEAQEEGQAKISWYVRLVNILFDIKSFYPKLFAYFKSSISGSGHMFGFIFACATKDGSWSMTRCVSRIFRSRTGIR